MEDLKQIHSCYNPQANKLDDYEDSKNHKAKGLKL
jgi:hypothetical protein